jgi:hypothetical protein
VIYEDTKKSNYERSDIEMKKFSYARFRELCDKADMAVAAARLSHSPETLSLELIAWRPDGTKMFTWDHDHRVWISTIVANTKVEEVIPFIKRRQCLHRLIAKHSTEFEPRFIRQTQGSIAIHPAIYYAAGNADVVEKQDQAHFDIETFRSALAEWVLLEGY